MLDIDTEEELVQMVGGKFRLTSLMQKRIVELNRGAAPLVEFEDNDEPTLKQIVIKEILEGKIELAQREELDQALQEAGVAREPVYVTNAVKHFKFVPSERGQRRIHKTPSRVEVVSCRPWLLAEVEAVRPEVLVLLGATAAKSLFGAGFRLTHHRGEVLRLPDDLLTGEIDPRVIVTVHPASVLRGPMRHRDEALASMVADLRSAAGLLD